MASLIPHVIFILYVTITTTQATFIPILLGAGALRNQGNAQVGGRGQLDKNVNFNKQVGGGFNFDARNNKNVVASTQGTTQDQANMMKSGLNFHKQVGVSKGFNVAGNKEVVSSGQGSNHVSRSDQGSGQALNRGNFGGNARLQNQFDGSSRLNLRGNFDGSRQNSKEIPSTSQAVGLGQGSSPSSSQGSGGLNFGGKFRGSGEAFKGGESVLDQGKGFKSTKAMGLSQGSGVSLDNNGVAQDQTHMGNRNARFQNKFGGSVGLKFGGSSRVHGGVSGEGQGRLGLTSSKELGSGQGLSQVLRSRKGSDHASSVAVIRPRASEGQGVPPGNMTSGNAKFRNQFRGSAGLRFGGNFGGSGQA